MSLKGISLKGKSDKETSFLKAAAGGKVEKVLAGIRSRKVRIYLYANAEIKGYEVQEAL